MGFSAHFNQRVAFGNIFQNFYFNHFLQIALFLLIVWTAFVGWLSVRLTRKLPDSPKRYFIRLALFAALWSLAFIDELIGKWQFERLCQENATVYIAPDAKGRTVYLADTPDEAPESVKKHQ